MKDGGFFTIGDFIDRISLWKILRIVSVLILISVIYSISVEAYTINKAFVWLTERVLSLKWQAPSGGYDHYRVEISKTNLLEEPVTTSVYHDYTELNSFNLDLQNDHSYLIRVQSVNSYGILSDYSDSTSLFIFNGGEVAKEASVADITPVEFSLSQNYPNPFNAQTTIAYNVPGLDAGVRVNLTIFNILGQRVKTLVNEIQDPGKHVMVWNGRDESDREVASGHYLYQLSAGKFRNSKKMIFMK